MAKKQTMKTLDWLAVGLLEIGGLVHGGQAFGFYAVDQIAQATMPWVAPLVYGAVGVSAIYGAGRLLKMY